MPIEGDVFAIAKVLRAGSNVYEDTREAGELLKTALIVAVSHPGSGRVYTTGFFTDRGGKVHPIGTRTPHQASAPGEPPAPDSLQLMNSIDFSGMRLPDGTELTVGANAKQAVFTEFGTSKMQARPWFRTTVLRKINDVIDVFAKGIERREREKARQLGGEG